MANPHEHQVIEAMTALLQQLEALPESEAAAALLATASQLEEALRGAGYELPRPAWMGRPRW